MKMSQLRFSKFTFGCAITMAACSQGPVNIGENNGSAESKTGLAAYAANWAGYAEARQFIDGSDVVRISVTNDGTGTIRFGNHDLWSPASDPDAEYPPDFSSGATPSACAPLAVAWDGFLHPLKALRVEQDRLRASVASQAVFESWCKLQTPVALALGGYSCINSDTWIPGYGPSCTVGADAGPSPCAAYQWRDGSTTKYELVAVSCPRASLCYDQTLNTANPDVHPQALVCTCTESGCQLGNVPNDIVLDAALDVSQQNMTGTLVIGPTNYTIRLKRQ